MGKEMKKSLRKALRLVKRLPKEEYNDDALAVLLLRIYYGFMKTNKLVSDSSYIRDPFAGIHKRLNWYEGTGETRHLIDAVRYCFWMLSYVTDKQGPKALPIWYQKLLEDGTVFKFKNKDDRLSMMWDFR